MFAYPSVSVRFVFLILPTPADALPKGMNDVVHCQHSWHISIQGAYKLPEDFAKPYFHKYWTEIHGVTTIWKRNVGSFIVTLNAFDVRPTCDTADVQATRISRSCNTSYSCYGVRKSSDNFYASCITNYCEPGVHLTGFSLSSAQYFFLTIDRGEHIFRNSMRHIKILGAGRVTWSKFHTEDLTNIRGHCREFSRPGFV